MGTWVHQLGAGGGAPNEGGHLLGYVQVSRLPGFQVQGGVVSVFGLTFRSRGLANSGEEPTTFMRL
jgi:hypothetical protein